MPKEPGNATVVEALGMAALLAAFLFGGMAFGLGIALLVGGGSPGALIVGFLALPLAFGLGMTAWRSILGAWLVAHLARSAARSRGDEDRFREEVTAVLGGIGSRGPANVPGTWVLVPTDAAVVMLLVAGGSRVGAAVLLFAGCLVVGMAMRRLARAGRLPFPDE